MAAAGGDVIGLDWRIPLDRGWAEVGHDRAVQGNLDPAVLLGPWERVERAARHVLDLAGGRPGHIFNLGHGVLPATDPDDADAPRSVRARAERGGGGGMSEVAVVLMAYGSPKRIEDVPAYYADIRGGRPSRPSCSMTSSPATARSGSRTRTPLNEITERDARRARASSASRSSPGCATGSRGSPRRSSRRSRAARGRSSGSCSRRTGRRSRSEDRGLLVESRRRSRRDSASSSAGATSPASSSCCARARARREESRTSSSPPIRLPARILDEGDPYRDELLETARLVAEAAGVEEWSFGFQSESPTGEPWLGPDILDHSPPRGQGVRDVLVCPVGFVADHLEIRRDIDIEAVERAGELGLRLRRIEMPKDDPALVRVLAGIVRREAALPAPA